MHEAQARIAHTRVKVPPRALIHTHTCADLMLQVCPAVTSARCPLCNDWTGYAPHALKVDALFIVEHVSDNRDAVLVQNLRWERRMARQGWNA